MGPIFRTVGSRRFRKKGKFPALNFFFSPTDKGASNRGSKVIEEIFVSDVKGVAHAITRDRKLPAAATGECQKRGPPRHPCQGI